MDFVSAARSSQRSDRHHLHHPASRTAAGGQQLQSHLSVRSRVPCSSRRSVTPNSRILPRDDDPEPGRVRVAIRLRPKNEEEFSNADFSCCVELQPEMKKLKLRKNNWSSDSYQFDEVFAESASQKRVYEVVAKPVVESVLDGYNGTILAYGQTGTGKTYTLGRLGKDDPSERGIMVRAMEDIIAKTSLSSDNIEISYLQLYMESVQDLLNPERINIPIAEDPKTGEVSLPGASIVKIQNLDQFLQLLQTGEANRHAANTKLNTESSRSHAMLMICVKRSIHNKEEGDISVEGGEVKAVSSGGHHFPVVRKSKLLIVDLAGSERLNKSGSEGHLVEEAKFINLSLTSLGKCINALAENSLHIPTRDSKLTRMLRDSFGGSARTSLIITIGPSSCHHAETTSTIMFGQRAMKVVNMMKLKVEFDYESMCRKLENQVDHLTSEIDRQLKLRETERNEVEIKLRECKNRFVAAEKDLIARSEFLEKENTRLESEVNDLLNKINHQKEHNDWMHDEVANLETTLKHTKHETSTFQQVLADTTQMYEKKISELMNQLEDEHNGQESTEKQLKAIEKLLCDHQMQIQKQEELQLKLQEISQSYEVARGELESLKLDYKITLSEKVTLQNELQSAKQALLAEEKRRRSLENELLNVKKLIPKNEDGFKDKRSYMKENMGNVSSGFGNPLAVHKSNQSTEAIHAQRNSIAKICEEVGLDKIITLLKSGEPDVQIHAVKVVANLAAEDINQERIVQEGGLDALLMLLRSSQNMTILRVASGAIANLAMNETNQGLIVSKGGARLLANTASKTEDFQTLRMAAGAIANLCGNEKLHVVLRDDGCIEALLGMVKFGNSDVIAQVARGLANYAKCESREIIQGHRRGCSRLMEDGVLTWLVANSNISSASIRRHVELALCHLAQNENNARDFIFSGAVKELVRISRESSKEDIRNLAKKALKLNPSFQTEPSTE